MQTREYGLLIAAILLPLTTPVVLWVFYEPEVFHRWPWIRVTLLLILLDWLSAVIISLSNRMKIAQMNDERIGYGFLIAFLVLPFLLYPGTDALGIGSDPDLFHILPLFGLIHGLACWSMVKWLEFLEQNKRISAKEIAEMYAQAYLNEKKLSNPALNLVGSWFVDEYRDVFPPLAIGGPSIGETIFVVFKRAETSGKLYGEPLIVIIDQYRQVTHYGFEKRSDFK